ncbi:MAG TPA: hypothetical protein VH092_20910, partial [Urbifossiella sp.]|nr:hypothetical protein [Urbifossiella sp.]
MTLPDRARCGHRGIGNGHRNAPPPSSPTRFAPGSPERLAILAERAARGEELHHPADATFATAEPTTAPLRLTDRRVPTIPAAKVADQLPAVPPAPAVVHEQPATSARPVPRLRLHRGTRVWRVAFKVRGRRLAIYFGREQATAAARYQTWAASWPAPLQAEALPARDRSRRIDTPAGPER